MLMDNKKIGERIMSLRKQTNMTQTKLSEKLGVSHQAVSKWENGECLPDIEVLVQLAAVFNLAIEDILLFDRDNDYIEREKKFDFSWDFKKDF